MGAAASHNEVPDDVAQAVKWQRCQWIAHCGHRRSHDLVATQKIADKYGKYDLHAPEEADPKEKSNGKPARQRFRGISDLQ